MSQPSQKGPIDLSGVDTSSNSSEGVDVNDLEVELLIICKNPAAFQQSASYLTKRGWPTTVVGNLSKAIDVVVKNSPDFVLVSANHPNPGTARLPALLSQAYNIEVIAFAETSDAATAARLAGSPIKHKVQGLPSGPNIQRVIRKILMDLYSSGGSLPQHSHHEDEHQPSSDAIEPQKPTNDDEEALDAGSYRLTRKKERTRLKDVKAARWVPAGPEKQVDRSALLELADQAFVRGESGMMFMPSKESEKGGDEGPIVQKGQQTKARPPVIQEGIEAKDRGPVVPEPTEHEKTPLIIGEGKDKSGETLIAKGVESEAFRASGGGRPEVQAQQGPLLIPLEKRKRAFARQGILQKSIEQTLQDVCKPGAYPPVELDSVEVMGVLPIDSADLHGYLVMAAPKITAEQQMEFLRKFRDSLQGHMQGNGVPAGVDDGFVVTMDEFRFKDWMKSESTIAFLSVHEGAQVAVTFLPTDERLPKPKETSKEDMAAISVDEIDTDNPVPFKAYLHFERNGKFFLYLRNGRRLYPDQKARLQDKQVSDFYIKSIDVKNYKSYSAATYLQRSTRKFRKPTAA